ncbi:MIP family channel protein [Ectocarpus siliculosus]|uniref:MIP family channel protein n=1 Tax=Ectocarpus siliculosus TaxID=2880 RepID=D7G9C4_ECTSI|nr:MIP family channel protein [Ectocarpus siliculosus]|eukprot:CBJ28267.1 MIP family channel protein [Ectocarpus siliculosus]
MAIVIAVGNGAIANEVLKKTKGHALGLGFVAIAFGMAFFLAISMFGHISANVNPAMLVAKAFLGRLAWKDALALSVANILGGFLGGVVVYGLYFAHFSIVPERPSPPRWDDAFVDSSYAPPTHTRNAYISYEPRHRTLSNEERRKVVFRYRPTEASGNGDKACNSNSFPHAERSNSIQVGTMLHEHDKARDPVYGAGWEGTEEPSAECHDEHRSRVDLAETQQADRARSSSRGLNRVLSGESLEQDGDYYSDQGRGAEDCAPVVQSERTPRTGLRLRQVAGIKFGGVQLHEASRVSTKSPRRPPSLSGFFSGIARMERAELENQELISQLERDGITKKDVAVYRGMLIADQNAKLAAFASRPAVLNYAANTVSGSAAALYEAATFGPDNVDQVAEIIGTFALIWSALMLEERVNLLETPEAADNLMPILGPLLIGFLVLGLVTAMAGPTGYASNPARDLGPRIAHFVLPIPNKGPSEWYYAFVPVVGPLIGGFLGAAAFYGCIQLNDYPAWFEGPTNTFGGSWEL